MSAAYVKTVESIGESDVDDVIRECRARLECAGQVDSSPATPGDPRMVWPVRYFALEGSGRVRELTRAPEIPWGCFVLYSDGSVARMLYDPQRPAAP